MTTTKKTIIELLNEVHQTMTDVALAEAIGVTGQTVYRWRHERTAVQLPQLVRAKLVEILAR